MTGDQILENRKTDKDYKWEKRALEFKRWIIDVKKLAEKTAITAVGTVRSFFLYHRVGLKFRPTEKRRLGEARAKYEDYRFNKEELAKMASVANLTEQYVLVVGKSFGFRAGDFLALTRGDLEAYIDREPPISIGEYSTQKESVKAYPFIDTDAKPVIKLILQKMKREGRTDPSERMLTYTNTIQLSRIIRRLTERAGINIGNKRVRFHCLRKFLCDRLSAVMSESKWKQVVGKAISEDAYISDNLLRESYERAMAETTFPKATISESDIRIKNAIDNLRMSGRFPEEVLEQLQKKWLGKDPDIAVRNISLEGEALQRIADREEINISDVIMISKDVIKEEMEIIKKERMRPRTATNGGCSNGHNCQQLVGEDELPQLLTEGWQVQAVLQSGKIVVER